MIVEVFKYIATKRLPIFIELIDKKYYLCINIVNCFIMPPFCLPNETAESLVVKNFMADFLYESFPDLVFTEFTTLCNRPSEQAVLDFFNRVIKTSAAIGNDISKAIFESATESLDDYHQLKESGGDDTYKKFLPIPDRSKRETDIWILPHYSCFTNIYARINKFNNKDLSGITIIHDAQSHFDEIIQKAKRDAEAYRNSSLNDIVPNSDYIFDQAADLIFADSKKSLGLQVADLLAGFTMRYVSEHLLAKAPEPPNAEAFDIIFNQGKPNSGVGLNMVCTQKICDSIYRPALERSIRSRFM